MEIQSDGRSPFFFGETKRQLFGFLHSPKQSSPNLPAVLICSPLGTEYKQSHHLVHQLANQLARAGYSVLRFNYFGTGNAGGAANKVTFSGLVADTRTAAEELRAQSGTSDLVVIGIRAGATVAAVFSASCDMSHLCKLVLWDAFVDGAGERRLMAKRLPWANGFDFSKLFLRDLQGRSPSAIESIGGKEALVLRTHADSPDATIVDCFVASGERVEFKQYPELAFAATSQSVPYQVLNHIVKWVKAA